MLFFSKTNKNDKCTHKIVYVCDGCECIKLKVGRIDSFIFIFLPHKF